MVILTLTHMYPYPATDGGKIVTYNTLKYMHNKGIKNILITFSESNQKTELDDVAEVYTIEKDTRNNIWQAFKNIISSMPYNMYKYKDNYVIKKIDEIVKNNKIDVIYIDHLHMAIYANYIKKKYPNIPLVLRQHNVETTIMERFYKNNNNFIIKNYAYIQYLKLKKYESKIVDKFDLVLMLTEDDKKRMNKMCKNKNIKVIPAGVDIERYYPRHDLYESNSIVFLGAMNWLPNEDGMIWFIENVFDKILSKNKSTKLYIVGKNPSNKIKELAHDNIIVTGFVDDDREYIAKSSVFIVPLRIGGGMRIKILNAMAMEKCIVSTSIGAEGINVINQKEILIEDEASKLAKIIIKAMDDDKLNKEIGKNARKKIEEKYSWTAVTKKIEQELKKLCN